MKLIKTAIICVKKRNNINHKNVRKTNFHNFVVFVMSKYANFTIESTIINYHSIFHKKKKKIMHFFIINIKIYIS